VAVSARVVWTYDPEKGVTSEETERFQVIRAMLDHVFDLIRDLPIQTTGSATDRSRRIT